MYRAIRPLYFKLFELLFKQFGPSKTTLTQNGFPWPDWVNTPTYDWLGDNVNSSCRLFQYMAMGATQSKGTTPTTANDILKPLLVIERGDISEIDFFEAPRSWQYTVTFRMLVEATLDDLRDQELLTFTSQLPFDIETQPIFNYFRFQTLLPTEDHITVYNSKCWQWDKDAYDPNRHTAFVENGFLKPPMDAPPWHPKHITIGIMDMLTALVAYLWDTWKLPWTYPIGTETPDYAATVLDYTVRMPDFTAANVPLSIRNWLGD